MKNMRKYIKYLYCFNSLAAKRIEITIISISLFGVILTIIALAVIHWKYTSKVMKVFQVLSLIFFFILIIITSFFLYLRNKYTTIKYITISILLCFLEIFLCIFSIFINLVTAIGALPDLREYNNKKETNIYEQANENVNTYENNDGSFMVSNGEFSYGIIYIIFIIFGWIVLTFLCISDLIRIKLGISGSYNSYIKLQNTQDNAQENTQENSKTDINTFQVYRKEEEKYYDKSREKKENGMTKQLSDQFKNENKDILNNKTLNKFDSEKKDILRYSYKENYLNRYKNCNSVDDIHKSKAGIDKSDKEKYFEKYMEGNGANPYYSNFGNKSILNFSTMNNSINPGY